jgi:murein DD-endopeptidase MepM/ murein hydrolase activator NlpD
VSLLIELENKKSMKKKTIILVLALFLVIITGIGLILQTYFSRSSRARKVMRFIRQPGSQEELIIPALSRCGDAPFLMPSTGMVGFIWDDSFRPGHRHQGIDIFSGTDVGETPIYAAYDGYLTRQVDWRASLIIRIPSDPLNPDKQIWTYYTHLADSSGNSLVSEAFPPGTTEKFVAAGTYLGLQGNYSGTPGNPTGIHLHFSIVKDDGSGVFLNELKIENTLDPSPYFGMALNANENKNDIPACNNE